MVARTVAAGPVLRVQQPPAMVLNREPIDADGQSVNQIICHQPKTCDMFGRNSPHKKLPFLVALSRVTFTQNSDILSSCYSLQVKSYTARFSPDKINKKNILSCCRSWTCISKCHQPHASRSPGSGNGPW